MQVILDNRERLRRMTLNLIDMLRARGYDMTHEDGRHKRFSDKGAFIDDLDTPGMYGLRGTATNPKSHKRIGYVLLNSSRSATYAKKEHINAAKDSFQPFLRSKLKAEDHPKQVHYLLLVIDKPMQKGIFEALDSIKIEVFQINDLLHNITKHFLVPDHRLLSPIEKEVTLKLIGLSEEQLHGMHIHDPVTRYYGGKPGDIFYIQRYEIKNTGMVRSRAELRIVRFITEAKSHITKSPALSAAKNGYKPSGVAYEKRKTMRKPEIRQYRNMKYIIPQ